MKKLKELHTMRQITQSEVAKALNIERAIYSQYELGKRSPNINMLIKISNFYKVFIDY